jgi:predicted type IV restriction endonuclease
MDDPRRLGGTRLVGAPRDIVRLINLFGRNQADYRSATYREYQLRQEFLDPCFRALGWDMDNRAGAPLAYREVIHEDALRIGTATKAPDYCFLVNGTRKFFVEAKRPAVNLSRDPTPAYQLRRYAWSANLPLSILTDFQEWAVYDCRHRPTANDNPSVSRLLYFTYSDLDDAWDELEALFSKESVSAGSIERFVSTASRKRGMAEVDEAFLIEIESWRKSLASDIARNNGLLDSVTLNVVVQQLIDRIVFLRICEDRGIEEYGQLREMAEEPNVYPSLLEIFFRADLRYNSGLFHFQSERDRREPDIMSPSLNVSDVILRQVISRLYYPASPYEFSVLPARILGQVYERFLGSVIRLTPKRSVKIEHKPEVAKAGGVYYTPGYIVDEIVENTLGQLLGRYNSRVLGNVRNIRVVDPACGSGSFLLGTYERLLTWYQNYYIANGPEKYAKEIYLAPAGDWRLTIAERKQILLTHIFGVDVDAQAVETTKLSLLLKVLEGESAETVGRTLTLFHDRALPDLDRNIQCGNSLVGPDLLGADDDFYGFSAVRVRPFDWQHAFPDVFGRDNPGFDAVIGNPPYISMLTLVRNIPLNIKDYWKESYESAAGAYDLYILFIEQGLRLCRNGGLLSYIVPNKFLAAEYAMKFRAMIARDVYFERLIDYSRTRVWKRSVYPVVPLFVKRKPRRNDELTVLTGDPVVKTQLYEVAQVPRAVMTAMPDLLWSFVTHSGVDTLVRIIERSRPLDSVAEIYGSSTVAEGSAFPENLSSLKGNANPPGSAARFLVTGSILRFRVTWSDRLVTYMHQSYKRPILHLARPVPDRRIEQARSAKIILGKVAKQPKAFLDVDGQYAAAYCSYIFGTGSLSLEFLCGLLNSRLMFFAARMLYDALAMSGGYIGFQPPQLRRLPVCHSTPKNGNAIRRVEKCAHDLAEAYTESQQLSTARDAEILSRRIAGLEATLDEAVYDAYDLKDSDRQVIEAFYASLVVEEGEDELEHAEALPVGE